MLTNCLDVIIAQISNNINIISFLLSFVAVIAATPRIVQFTIFHYSKPVAEISLSGKTTDEHEIEWADITQNEEGEMGGKVVPLLIENITDRRIQIEEVIIETDNEFFNPSNEDYQRLPTHFENGWAWRLDGNHLPPQEEMIYRHEIRGESDTTIEISVKTNIEMTEFGCPTYFGKIRFNQNIEWHVISE